ncbi:MAG: biotin/lipoyl-binding protein [Candidatus Moraniibacteriota bacterium]
MFKAFISRVKNPLDRTWNSMSHRPVTSFVVILLLLFGIIFLSNKLRAPKDEGAPQTPAERSVSLFTIGTDSPLLPTQGEVKDSGIIDVVAITPGIVKRLLVIPGQRVTSGQTLLELTSDYGANAGALRTQIASENQSLTEETKSLQKKLLELQARIAKDQTTSSREKKAATTNLKIEKKRLNASVTVSELSTALSAAENASLRPRAIVSGTVTSLPVSLGDFVNAGTVLATLSTGDEMALIEVKLPASIALLFDPNGKSILRVDNQDYPIIPRFFSPNEDSAGLVTLQFTTPLEIQKGLIDHSFVTLEVALGSTIEESALVPLDALFRDKEGGSVLVLDENNTALLKRVTLEKIIGNFALIRGVNSGDRLIIDRLTAAGEHVNPIVR